MQSEAVLHPGLHQEERPHQYIKDRHLPLHRALSTILTALTVREEAQKADIQEIHTTETVLHQAQAILAAAHLPEDIQGEVPASPEVHHQEEATAEVHHQEAIDDKNIKT